MQPMNLGRMAQAVEDELQQAPDVRRWRALVRQRVNDAYTRLWELRPWPFRIRTAPLWVYPDFTIDLDDLTLAHVTAERVYDGTNFVGTLTNLMFPAEENVGSAVGLHLEQLQGAELGIEPLGSTSLGNGNWNEGPFVIERMQDFTSISSSVRLWLDPRARATAQASGGRWSFRFPRYLLPHDCEQLMMNGGVTDEDGYPLKYVDPETYRAWQGGTGRPPAAGGGFSVGWTYDSGVDLTGPLDRSHSPNLWTPSNTTSPAWFDHDRNSMIRETIVGALNAAPSTFTVGQQYRFAVAWYYASRFGPLSNIVELTPTTGTPSVTLSSLPSLPNNVALSPVVPYGWVLAVFVAKGDGPFYLLQYIDPPPSSGGTSTSITLSAIPGGPPWKRIRYDVVYRENYRYIRLLTRPSAHKKYSLRYLRFPAPLLDDNDVPELPAQFHMAIVYDAAADLVKTREGGSRTSLYLRLEASAKLRLSEMAQFYFPGQHRAVQKGSILTPSLGPGLGLRKVDWNGDS